MVKATHAYNDAARYDVQGCLNAPLLSDTVSSEVSIWVKGRFGLRSLPVCRADHEGLVTFDNWRYLMVSILQLLTGQDLSSNSNWLLGSLQVWKSQHVCIKTGLQVNRRTAPSPCRRLETFIRICPVKWAKKSRRSRQISDRTYKTAQKKTKIQKKTAFVSMIAAPIQPTRL